MLGLWDSSFFGDNQIIITYNYMIETKTCLGCGGGGGLDTHHHSQKN